MSGQLIGRGYMTIVGLKDGDPANTYVLLPSVESVTKKLDGTLSVGEVYCSVYKVTGSAAYALSADHTLRYVRKPDGATDILEHANGVSGSITVLSDTESIEFELSDSSNVIDRVRIPILSDATDVNDELDLYRYLREAIANGDTQFKGGLMLSSLIRLGEWANANTDNPTMAKVWSGMNGLYKNGRTIANWWGGDMVDLFDENDNLIIPAPANAAAGLVRMDGSYYYSNGNIGGRADGSIWVGGQDGLKIDKNGHITLGSGIHIGTGDGTDPTTLASILNFINNLTKLIVPVNEQKEELSWAHPDVADCYALKAKKGLFSMGFLSAHGLNADGGNSGGSGGGAAYDRLDEWSTYDEDKSGWVLSALLGHDLHTRLAAIEGDYVKLTDLPSLTGYATEQWVLAKGYITQDALTPYLTKTDASLSYQPKGDYVKTNSDATLSQLTLASDHDTKLVLDNTDNETYWSYISFRDHGTEYGRLGTRGTTELEWSTHKILHTGNTKIDNGIITIYGTSITPLTQHQPLHTLTLQLNGTEIGTFNPTANKTINIGDVASAAALASHTSNTTVHITATERALWNKAASDLSTILGSDSDTVINKWEEVVAFLDTYTEADTLAGLLSNKVDKVAGYGLSKNDFNDTLLAKLNSIEAGANRYVLPTASATVKGGIKVGSGLMMASEVLSVNLNASHIPALDWSKITTGKPTTLAGYGITDAYTKAESDGLFAPAVAYNYADGCLVRLKIPANEATMTAVLIEGNSYWVHTPIKSIVQFYNYPHSNEIINYGATHYGADFGDIKAFTYDGHLYLWFIQDMAFFTFAVTAICTANYNTVGNAVESITNAPMPTEGVTRLVTITPSKGLRTDNYASLLDSRYQLSANIHALTFTAGAFSAKTYDPKSAALTVNIPNTTDHIAEGGNLYFTNARAVSALSSTTNALQAAINTKLSEATFNAFKTAFDGMFELVNIGTDAAPLFAIHAKYGLYSDSFLSAHGRNDAGGSGGSSYSRLDAWSAYDSSKEGYVLSAKLGYDLYQNKADSVALSALASRVGTLEGKNYLDALTLNQSGSGNAVTAIGLSADKKTLTVIKGATFLTQHQDISGLLSKTEAASFYQPKGNYLTQHQSLANYYTKPEIDNKVVSQKKAWCFDTSIYDLRYNFGSYDRNDFPTGEYYSEYPSPYGKYISLAHDNKNSAALIFIDSGDLGGHVFINTRKAGDSHTTYDGWKKVAYVTDTVDNALKLGGVAASGYAKLTDIPSLSGYATESWVLGKNYLTAITKAMVENVLTGNITTHTHSQYLTQHQPLDHIDSLDTRGDATTPSTYGRGLRANFKINSVNGLSDGGTYNGELHFKPYGSTGDHSGGYPHQLGFTVNGNVWHRIATSATDWGAWRKFLDSDNTRISDGVITINGTSITPLTSHQSLANYYTKGEVDTVLNGYVTLNTPQTISGAKTFSNIVVVQDGIRILYANERGYLQLGNTDHKQGEISAWNGVTLEKLRLNAGIVDVYGYVTANSFVRNGGTSAQFLKADGSVDSNSYALASALGNYLPLAGGTMLNTNLVSNLNADLLDGVHKDAFNGAARYGTTEIHTSGYYKVKIKAYTHWMLAFKIIAYQNYNLKEIVVTGYNYSIHHWTNPTAALVNSQAVYADNQVTVTFGYDSDSHLWVAIPASHYAGITVTDVANGFLQVSNVQDLFEIVYEETLTGTVQAEITASRHATIADNVASASRLQTGRLINGTAFDGTADVLTAKWGMARNITIGNTAKSVDGSGNVAWSLADIGALPLVGGTMANANLVTNLNADLLDGRHAYDFLWTGLITATTDADTFGEYGVFKRPNASSDCNFPTVAGGSLINMQGEYGRANQLFFLYGAPRVWYRPSGYSSGRGEWSELAFLSSNVASATKLADNATYTAWGRPFFANGKPQNVSGALRGVTELYTSGPLWFKKTDESKGAYFSPAAGGSIGLYFHENYGYKLCTAYFAYNGNIGFGTVNPAYKVDIVGTAKISEGLLIGGLLSANGGISTTAITATEIHLGPITLKYSATDKGLQVIGGGLYTDSYLSAHGPSPTTVDYEARIAALESKIAQLENQLSA